MKKTVQESNIILFIGKTLFLLLFLLVQNQFAMAQDDDRETDDIKAVRVAYMTDKLKLSSDEAQKFWPVYNNYRQEIRHARRENAGDVVKQREAMVNVQKKYKDNFKRVLNNDERVNRVFTSEQEVQAMLRNEWQKRHPNGGGSRQFLPMGLSPKRN